MLYQHTETTVILRNNFSVIFYFFLNKVNNNIFCQSKDQSEEKRPTPLKWNPEESLAFLQSALEGARVEESHEKDTEKVIEATDKYIVVFKEEATTQDGEACYRNTFKLVLYDWVITVCM